MKRRREITSNKMFNSIFISQQNRCDMINFQLPTNSMEKLTQKLSKSESLSFIVMSLPPLSFALISGGTLLVWASWEHDGNTKANEMRSGGKAISRFTFFTFLCKLHSGKIKWQKNFMFFLSLASSSRSISREIVTLLCQRRSHSFTNHSHIDNKRSRQARMSDKSVERQECRRKGETGREIVSVRWKSRFDEWEWSASQIFAL